MLGQKLEENIQFKIDKILTDFVVEYSKDDNEERVDALHNQTVEELLNLFKEMLYPGIEGSEKI